MRKREPDAPKVLLAGDTADLPTIRERLRDCQADASGIVLIEAINALQVVPLDAPAGIGVHWLFRERADAAVEPRGSVLVTAVDTWLDEWMRPEGGVEVSPWIGARSSEVVDAYARQLDRELAAGLPA